MKLTSREVADMLGIPELTLQRWVRQGKIPARAGRGGDTFLKKDIEKWAHTHNIFVKTGSQTDSPLTCPEEPSLFDALKRGGVFFHLKGNSVSEVLRETVGLAPLPERIDREFLLDMLHQREKLASTGIGSGIAIPHPRYPLQELSEHSFITTCFLDRPIDYNTVDKVPVFVLFLLMSCTTTIHLNLLSRLSFCLRDAAFISFLKTCKTPEDLWERIRERESSLNQEPEKG